MSVQPQGFYQVTEMVYNYFRGQEGVGQIELGLRPTLDSNKEGVGMFILISPENINWEQKYNYFSFTIYAFDFVDITNRDIREMPNFQGLDNLQDVWHEASTLLTKFANVLTRGDLNADNWDVRVGAMEVFQDVEPNLLAGWALSIEIGAPHYGFIC